MSIALISPADLCLAMVFSPNSICLLVLMTSMGRVTVLATVPAHAPDRNADRNGWSGSGNCRRVEGMGPRGRFFIQYSTVRWRRARGTVRCSKDSFEINPYNNLNSLASLNKRSMKATFPEMVYNSSM